MITYFQEIFQMVGNNQDEEIIDVMDTKVTVEMNRMLDKATTEKQVRETVF